LDASHPAEGSAELEIGMPRKNLKMELKLAGETKSSGQHQPLLVIEHDLDLWTYGVNL